MEESNSKLFSFLEKAIMGPLGKMAQFKIVRAIMAAGMASVPFTIVGSMFLVFNILPLTFPALEGIFEASFFRFSDLYMLATGATMGLLSLYFCIVIGYEYTKIISEEEGLDLTPINGALLGVFAFFMSIPQIVFENGSMTRITDLDSNMINGWAIGGDGVARLGSVGIFTGIIVAIVAVRIYRLCIVKNWIVKLPEEVPLGVARAFTSLIPTFLVAVVILLINGTLIVLGTDIFDAVAIPFGFVANITNSWAGIMVIYFFIHALWLVGIHGANVINPLITPIMLNNLVLNADGANYPFAGEFGNAFVVLGGSGATLGLTLFLLYLAKSKQLKVLGKAAIAPAIFNINEPLIFGLPIIYNPFLAIPFFLAPMVAASIAFFAIRWELVSPMIAQMPWPSPMGIGGFIGTGGDWRAIVLAVVCALAAFLVYLPFAKSYDSKLVKEENASASAE